MTNFSDWASELLNDQKAFGNVFADVAKELNVLKERWNCDEVHQLHSDYYDDLIAAACFATHGLPEIQILDWDLVDQSVTGSAPHPRN